MTGTLPVVDTARGAPAEPPDRRERRSPRMVGGPNVFGGLAALLWLVVILAPLYMLLTATLRGQSDYLRNGPLGFPTDPTGQNYETLLHNNFISYFGNTVLVTVASVAIVLVLSVSVGYAVVRSRTRLSGAAFRFFLLALAIPAQAVIIPVYFVITRLHLYDTLLAVILPTAAFSLPVCVLILTGTMRDIDEQLYEAMALDGATAATTLFRLVIPLSRSGIATVVVYSALQAWNGLIFPLVLTQSEGQRVLTVGLFDYVGRFGVNVPGLLAAVVLSGIPIFLVYLFARRWLVNGLMGVGGR